jgi:hypothetical protein
LIQLPADTWFKASISGARQLQIIIITIIIITTTIITTTTTTIIIIIIIIKAKQAIANFVCHAVNNNQQIVFNKRYLSCVE